MNTDNTQQQKILMKPKASNHILMNAKLMLATSKKGVRKVYRKLFK